MWVVKALKAPVVDCPTQLIYICQHTNKKTRKLNPIISRCCTMRKRPEHDSAWKQTKTKRGFVLQKKVSFKQASSWTKSKKAMSNFTFGPHLNFFSWIIFSKTSFTQFFFGHRKILFILSGQKGSAVGPGVVQFSMGAWGGMEMNNILCWSLGCLIVS